MVLCAVLTERGLSSVLLASVIGDGELQAAGAGGAGVPERFAGT